MEFHKKVELLGKYKDCMKLVKFYKQELDSYKQSQEQAKSQMLDDMPHSRGNSTDLSDYIVKVDEITGMMVSKMIKAEQVKTNIVVWVQSLENVNERLVLMYHYISDRTYGWISDEMGYSEKSIRRLRNKAIEHLGDVDEESWLDI